MHDVDANLELVELRLQAHNPHLVGSREAVLEQLAELTLRLQALRAEHRLPDATWTHTVLTELERDALWLIAAPYLDVRFRDRIARVNDNILYHYVDTSLCQRILATNRRERLALRAALAVGGSLHRAGLITHGRDTLQNPNPLFHELIPHSDILAHLTHTRRLSSSLLRFPALAARFVAPDEKRAALEFDVALGHSLRSFIASDLDTSPGRALILQGPEGGGRRTHVLAAATLLKRGVLELDAAGLHTCPLESQPLFHACREAALYGDVVLLRHADALIAPRAETVSLLCAALEHWPAHVICCVEPHSQQIDTRLEAYVIQRESLTLEPDVQRTQRFLHILIPGQEDAWPAELIQRSAAMTPLQMRKTVELADMLSEGQSPTPPAILRRAIQSQAHADLGHYARVSRPRVGFDDLVLPPDVLRQVRQVVNAVRNRITVLHSWKIAQRIRRGLGIVCLFDGEPGTGKTLSAEVIAGELELQLLRINVSNIVDKYIGETEKHLARIFERTQPESSILLFDEADALFSKRTEVKSSNDHYANMSINVLLQLIEAYTGVCILTTNLKKGIDNAFERRIMFKISYPLPENEEREKLWSLLLPPEVPRAETLDFDLLAEVEMSGGSIKNAILRAAYSAAEDGSLLTTDHLLRAAYKEASASGRLVRQFDEEMD